MADLAKEILRVNIEDEMRQSYLDYAMSVIVGRALPDVRDGLKPVHRRVLYAMKELGNDHNKPYKKSARVVGDVIGKYHPHGDTAVYDTIVRMAQPFSLRYLLIDGQGNFGSVDGDAPAAMRYTEVRLTRLAHELMRDIDKDTVDFQPNYDDKELEPTVLPTVVPNLLINGSSGIAVGMATNIPPHNLTEVVNALIALIADPDLSIEDLMQYVSGPDFPTAGIINGSYGIREAYRTGRGRILVRGKAEIETEGNREAIIITELPYQVNKARLVEKIAELVKAKEIEGIASDGLRDESDKDGMRVVIEVKRGENAEVLLNKLYKQTQLEQVFGINMVALVGGQPRTLNLKDFLEAFLRHRREVVTRRTIFDLRKARARAHVLEGLTVALANIDEMIELIKTSKDANEARERMLAKRWEPGLVRALLSAAGADRSRPEDLDPGEGLFDDGYQLSEIQAKEILEMRLQRLTGLEQDKLTDEYKQILLTIAELFRILEEPGRLMEVIQDELIAIRDEYGDERRTRIEHSQSDLDILDLIPPEDVVVTLSHAGYIKRQPLTVYRSQRRGGKGKSATALKDEDFIERLWIANTHDTLLAFTSLGRVFKLPVYQVPEASAGSRGRPIVNMLPLEGGEKIQAVLPVHAFVDDRYVFFSTRQGVVKKTPLSDFQNVRANGIRAVELDEGDGLVNVALTDGSRNIMLFGSHGKAVRFSEDEVRPMGRTARGVIGMRFSEDAGDARVVAMLMVDGDGDILTATARGFGKRTAVAEFPQKGRGTQGVIAIQTSERNGALVGAIQLTDKHDVMLISNQGTLVRTRASEISQVGRNTQGVTLIRLPEDETLVGLERLDAIAEEEGEGERPEPEGPGASV
ncbi:MAG: DNA gyrase subunit A [Lysobacterales bacterium]|nr:DNA gyrase subunit A [Xanthomonadales bacterium]